MEPGTAEAGYYIVYVYNDRSMTNVGRVDQRDRRLRHAVDATDDTGCRDSQAGTAYYWYVLAVQGSGRCSKDPRGTANAATHAFDKRSNPISGLEERIHDTSSRSCTGDVPEFDDEVVFSWDDYLDTNQAGNDLDVTAMPSTVEAHNLPGPGEHERHASRAPRRPPPRRWSDQTSYTVSSKTLPEGPLFWRVQAIDGDGNALAWSLNKNLTGNARAIKKVSPAPSLVSPANNGTSSGEPDLQVEPAQLRGEVQPRGLQEQRHDAVLRPTAWSA